MNKKQLVEKVEIYRLMDEARAEVYGEHHKTMEIHIPVGGDDNWNKFKSLIAEKITTNGFIFKEDQIFNAIFQHDEEMDYLVTEHTEITLYSISAVAKLLKRSHKTVSNLVKHG